LRPTERHTDRHAAIAYTMLARYKGAIHPVWEIYHKSALVMVNLCGKFAKKNMRKDEN